MEQINNGSKTEINKDKMIDNHKNQIDTLKKEIEDLKSITQRDQKNISELKLLFQTEIKKLQDQIKSLSAEIKTLKSKKNNKSSNNIDNIDNIDNNKIEMEESDDDNMEIDDHKYSLECLSRKLSTDIMQGTERTSMDIVVRNNSKLKFPNNSYLICDQKNSLLLCENIDLSSIEPNEQKVIKIHFKNLRYISKGEYKSLVKLMVENKVYNSSKIELTVNVISPLNKFNNQQKNVGLEPNLFFNNNLNNLNNPSNPFLQNDNNNIVSSFREQFSLFDYDNISDERIKNALMANNNDFNKAFESLYN